MISQKESNDANAHLGERYVCEYFERHKEALDINDMTVYNRMVLETGYKPVSPDIAVHLIKYIGEIRKIYSDPQILEIYKYYKAGMLKEPNQHMTIHIKEKACEGKNTFNS